MMMAVVVLCCIENIGMDTKRLVLTLYYSASPLFVASVVVNHHHLFSSHFIRHSRVGPIE